MKPDLLALIWSNPAIDPEFSPGSRDEERILAYHRRGLALWRGDAPISASGRGQGVFDQLSVLREDYCARDLSRIGSWVRGRAELLRLAQADAGPREVWLIESLRWLAHAAMVDADYEVAESLFLQLENSAERNQCRHRLCEAIVNLGSLACDKGDYAQAESRQRKLLELEARFGWNEARLFAHDLKAQLLATTGDADQAWRFFEDLEAGRLGSFGASYRAAFDFWIFVNLLQRGWLKPAKTVELCLQRHQRSNGLAFFPEAARAAALLRLVRCRDAAALLAVLEKDAAKYWDRQYLRITMTLGWAEVGYRLEPSGACEEAVSVALELLDRLGSLSKWAGVFRADLELAEKRVHFRFEKEVEPTERWVEAKLAPLLGDAFCLEAKELLLFRAEIRFASGRAEQCREDLRYGRDLCRAFSLDFDAAIFDLLLAKKFGVPLGELAKSLNVDATEAEAIAARLARGWPWSQDTVRARASAAATGPSRDDGLAALLSARPPSSPKARAFLKALLEAQGSVVDNRSLVNQIWGEDFDPTVHANRLYQLASLAREHLELIGVSGSRLAADYGSGYRLREAAEEAAIAQEIEAFMLSLPPERAVSAKELRERFGVSSREAAAHLKRLERAGLVKKRKRAGRVTYRSSQTG